MREKEIYCCDELHGNVEIVSCVMIQCTNASLRKYVESC